MDTDMYALLILVFPVQFGALSFIYCADRDLKLALKIGVKKIRQYTLTNNNKYFFVYTKRKEGIITRYAFMCMAAYYILNFAGLISVLFQIITESTSFSTITTCIIIFLNLGLLIAVAPPYRFTLNAEEQKTVKEEQLKIYIEARGKKLDKKENKTENSKREIHSKEKKEPRLKNH